LANGARGGPPRAGRVFPRNGMRTRNDEPWRPARDLREEQWGRGPMLSMDLSRTRPTPGGGVLAGRGAGPVVDPRFRTRRRAALHRGTGTVLIPAAAGSRAARWCAGRPRVREARPEPRPAGAGRHPERSRPVEGGEPLSMMQDLGGEIALVT